MWPRVSGCWLCRPQHPSPIIRLLYTRPLWIQYCCANSVYVDSSLNRARIFKLLWSPRIDSKESKFRQHMKPARQTYSYLVPCPHRLLKFPAQSTDAMPVTGAMTICPRTKSLRCSIPWTMRPFDDASRGRCVPCTSRPWPTCPDPGLLESTCQFGSGHACPALPLLLHSTAHRAQDAPSKGRIIEGRDIRSGTHRSGTQ